MNTLKFLTIASSLILSVACMGREPSNTEKDEAAIVSDKPLTANDFGLKGKVHTVTETSTDADITTIKEYTFGKDGRLMKFRLSGGVCSPEFTITFDKNGNGDTNYVFSECTPNMKLSKFKDGKPVEYVFTDEDGRIESYEIHAYDNQGRVVRDDYCDESKNTVSFRTYTYDRHGNITGRQYHSGNSTDAETWEYDNKGRLLKYSENGKAKETFIYRDDTIAEIVYNGMHKYFRYDKRKRLVSETWYDLPWGQTEMTKTQYDTIVYNADGSYTLTHGRFSNRWEYATVKFNKHGFATSYKDAEKSIEITYNPDDSTFSKISATADGKTQTYIVKSHDKYGNWIEKNAGPKEYNIFGNFYPQSDLNEFAMYFTTKRTLTYYK